MKRKGFTLIELLAVIIILAIITLIAVPLVLNLIENARKGASERSAEAYMKAVEDYILLSDVSKEQYSKEFVPNTKYYITEYHELESDETSDEKPVGDWFLENELKIKGEKAYDGYIITGSKNEVVRGYFQILGYIVECNSKNCKAIEKYKEEEINVVSSTSIIKAIGRRKFSDLITKIVANDTTYSVHSYVFSGDQVWSSNQVFGDENDVGSETEYAKNMVIVKVNGNLTINEGVTVSPYYTQYGGPKGFVLYVTGTLTNNGHIDNSHGAYAVGENVYLWQNEDKSYEYIPAIGGAGGASVTGTNVSGNSGENGQNRKTGGGGSGTIMVQTSTGKTKTGSAGSAGTSYSGGTGGAVGFGNNSGIVENAKENGGSGGSATLNSNISNYKMGGGAGNPGGRGKMGSNWDASLNGSNGTGGLLVIYADTIINNNLITADGSNGGGNATGYSLGGAGSGAGSINIFYKNGSPLSGRITVIGGNYGTNYFSYKYYSGRGGNGSITAGSIGSGTFIAD